MGSLKRAFLAGLSVVACAPGALAFSAIVSANELVSKSEIVMVAEVTEVVEAGAPPQKYRVATARVLEVWKGTVKHSEVQFIASRGGFMCDTSNARVGEKVVLFLRQDPAEPHPRIAHFGRGRLPVGTIDHTQVALIYEVTFPSPVRVHRERTYPERVGVNLESLRWFVRNHPSQFARSN